MRRRAACDEHTARTSPATRGGAGLRVGSESVRAARTLNWRSIAEAHTDVGTLNDANLH